ncbi:hypothetical protein NDU88_005059 [Pleurodeles waltl]|uniref:Uncharacterized protein n=1 Tax=Pleurodeles waltl TaxID=8319 RepID=A0AAV7M9F7_PLEWA|nr:hypothetical protein NDU88_005059 [Pleurodeles waltl]
MRQSNSTLGWRHGPWACCGAARPVEERWAVAIIKEEVNVADNGPWWAPVGPEEIEVGQAGRLRIKPAKRKEQPVVLMSGGSPPRGGSGGRFAQQMEFADPPGALERQRPLNEQCGGRHISGE